VPLLPTTNPSLDCRGEGIKRTFHPIESKLSYTLVQIQ
jgi:hypothetical protein